MSRSSPCVGGKPVWTEAGLIETVPLTTDACCDVCIVGAGIAGLLIAERLIGEGLDVVLLDSHTIGSGETGRTTAHVTCALDDRYSAIRRLHGKDGARLVAMSHAKAIDHLESLCHRLDIRCGFERLDGYLVVNERHDADRESLLTGELEAATQAGLQTERVAALPTPWPVSLGPALRFPRQAQFHPLEFLRGLSHHLMSHGVRIFTNTKAVRVAGGDDAHVETEGGAVVRCTQVVVATNTPVNNLVAVHTKQAGYQTYVLAFELPPGSLPPILLWDGLWKDDRQYHYVRTGPRTDSLAGGLLIVGGEDHKTGQGPDGDHPYQLLEHWTRSHFPRCGAVLYRWSGEVMEPADALAYIGPNPGGPRGVSIVTGDSGNGMTHGAIAALLLCDQITGRPNEWSDLYNPARLIGVRATGDFLRENLNTAAQYGDWLRAGDVPDEQEIVAGQGAIVRHGLRHLAIYKDESGRCTRLDATCTHLGGIVHWNSQERTWDCPCHASRFDRDGRVLHGPAIHDLRPAPEPAPASTPEVVHDQPSGALHM